MEKQYQRWICALLMTILAVLAAAGGFVWMADPCLLRRIPESGEAVFFNERYQNAGLLRHAEADTVVLGTSMVKNYRPSQVEAVFGGKAVKLAVPDGYMSEFDATLSAVFRAHPPKRVIFSLDANILNRDESGLTGALPDYLYNANPLDDIKYLLNKDTLYYSVYTLLADQEKREPLDDAFLWNTGIWWNHMTALENYPRPEVVDETLPADAFAANAAANTSVITGWLEAHPDTEFDILLSPYSLLYWDKVLRTGQIDAVFASVSLACKTLLEYDNVRLYGFLMDPEIVTNLDNYSDYVHCSEAVDNRILEKIQAGECRLSRENVDETLANWRTFVVNYNYDQFWDVTFWEQWNREHGIPSL